MSHPEQPRGRGTRVQSRFAQGHGLEYHPVALLIPHSEVPRIQCRRNDKWAITRGMAC